MPDSTKLVHDAIDLSDAEDYSGAMILLNEAIAVDSTTHRLTLSEEWFC